MALLKAKKAHNALLKKGFTLVESHHHLYEFWYDNKLVAKTRMSHNGQDVDKYLIGKMCRQCLLSKEDFLDLINCPMSKEMYIKKLEKCGALK